MTYVILVLSQKKELQERANKGKKVELETFLQSDIIISGLYIYRKEKLFKNKFYNIDAYEYINILMYLPEIVVYINNNNIMYIF